MVRLVAALGVAALTIGCGLVLDVGARVHASPDNCPPACDRIPDSAWIPPSAIPLNSSYNWPALAGLSVTATDPRFKFEELCAAVPARSDPRGYAVGARAIVPNPPGQWQLQVQVFHWRGEVWRAGQNSDAVVAAAATALRACQQTVPSVSPSITLEQTGRVAAVISVGGALPQVAHEYLVSHPLSGTLVELAMWATSPPLVGWPTVADEKILDALTAPLCAAYTGSCS